MTIQETIEAAIRGGWQPKGQHFTLDEISYKVQALNKVKYKERFFLDPLFWQALGKAKGWKKYQCDCNGCRGVKFPRHGKIGRDYLYYWHELIDHLAANKSIEDYFKPL